MNNIYLGTGVFCTTIVITPMSYFTLVIMVADDGGSLILTFIVLLSLFILRKKMGKPMVRRMKIIIPTTIITAITPSLNPVSAVFLGGGEAA